MLLISGIFVRFLIVSLKEQSLFIHTAAEMVIVTAKLHTLAAGAAKGSLLLWRIN